MVKGIKNKVEELVLEYLDSIGYTRYRKSLNKDVLKLEIEYDKKKRIYSAYLVDSGIRLNEFYLNKKLKPTKIKKTFKEYKKRTLEYLEQNPQEIDGRIKPLVHKLNSNPYVGIMESCEGHVYEDGKFAYGATWLTYFYLEKSRKAREFHEKLKDYCMSFQPETRCKPLMKHGKPSFPDLGYDVYYRSDKVEDLHYFANRFSFGILPAGIMFGGMVHKDRKEELEHNLDLFWKRLEKIL